MQLESVGNDEVYGLDVVDSEIQNRISSSNPDESGFEHNVYCGIEEDWVYKQMHIIGEIWQNSDPNNLLENINIVKESKVLNLWPTELMMPAEGYLNKGQNRFEKIINRIRGKISYIIRQKKYVEDELSIVTASQIQGEILEKVKAVYLESDRIATEHQKGLDMMGGKTLLGLIGGVIRNSLNKLLQLDRDDSIQAALYNLPLIKGEIQITDLGFLQLDGNNWLSPLLKLNYQLQMAGMQVLLNDKLAKEGKDQLPNNPNIDDAVHKLANWVYNKVRNQLN